MSFARKRITEMTEQRKRKEERSRSRRWGRRGRGIGRLKKNSVSRAADRRNHGYKATGGILASSIKRKPDRDDASRQIPRGFTAPEYALFLDR